MNGNFSTGRWSSIPPVTKNIIIINAIVWIAEFVGLHTKVAFTQTLLNKLALHYFDSSLFNPVQLLTYMFMHDPYSPVHILFNMFSLWMFGRILEQVWGSKRFFIFYIVCGIGAALVQEAVWSMCWMHDYVSAIAPQNGLTYEHMRQYVLAGIANGDASLLSAIEAYKTSLSTIGASGAVFGLLLGFAFVFPNMPLYLFFIPVPIKAKYMVIGYGVIEFFLGIAGGGTIAHFAHLGGMLFGLVLLLIWKKNGKLHGDGFY